MDDAVILEVLVANPDARFNPHDFTQIDPSNPEGHAEMAWNETFLTADGETVIETDYKQRLPAAKQYRVVFVIHVGSLASHCSPATESCMLRPCSD